MAVVASLKKNPFYKKIGGTNIILKIFKISKKYNYKKNKQN